ncbi:MAG TPA: DNA translocase FtsK [Blastocatellia bacterium]|nr:DNA translocase FtsK [Blastocatellia bacterium]
MSTKSRTKTSTKKSLANEVLAVVLVVSAILLALSLFSHKTGDLSRNTDGPKHEPGNLIGVVGAFISDEFLQWFGLASFLIPALLVIVALRAFSATRPGFPTRKAIGATLLLIAFSGFLALFPEIRIWDTPYHNGGAAGSVIKTGLAGLLSTTGAAIVLAAASVLTLMLTMEISLARVAGWVRSIRDARAEINQAKPTVFSRVTAWWEARAERRQLLVAQRRAEKEEEQKRKDEERAERDRLREIEQERQREERKLRMEEARRLKEQLQPTGPLVETITASTSRPEIAIAGGSLSSGAAARLASTEVVEAVPTPTPTRLQMRELVQEHAVRVEQIKSGRAPLAAEITMDPTVAEMISTASIVRTAATEKADTEAKSAKQTRRKNAVETLAGYVYKLPTIDLIEPPIGHFEQAEEELRDRATILAEKCKEFSVTGHIHRINPGPVVTTFEFKPDPGIKYSRVVGLADDLCLALKAESIRIDRIPGKSTVGIEAPNAQREKIFLRDVIESAKFQQSASKLTIALGKTINGEEYIADLAKMPHLLIAGATGAGKSVTLNAIICSVLYKASPEEVKFIMVDPKRVELGLYEGIPHLLTPIVTDPKRASNALKWAVNEMEARYRKLAALGVRNIEQYNRQVYEIASPTLFDDPAEQLKPLPYIVIAIDELADLMMIARSEVETSIARLAQMARAVGIHLVLATQRPSVDIITGVIKANIPCRMAFRVSSKVDSRTIIDSNGAEALLGQGDMLFLPPASSRLIRVHGSFASEAEIKRITDFIKNQAEPDYNEEVTLSEQETLDADGFEGEQDELFDEALAIVTDMGRASTSVLQRRLSIGYGRAAKILDSMERQGFIGPAEGSKPRKVLQAAHEFRERLAQRLEEDFD